MQIKRIIAGISSLVLMASAYSCGKTSDSSSTTADTTTASSASSENVPVSTENSSEEQTEVSSDGKEKSTEKTTSSKTTTAKSGDSGEKSSTTKADDTAVTTTKASGGTDSKVTTTKAAAQTTTAAVTTTALPNDDEPEEKVYTAEVSLGSNISVKGDNVKVDGSTVKISAGGSYLFTGKLSDGQIYVSTNTEEKVTLVLNGVDIACSYGPAIMVDEAKRCIVKVKEGTVNNLSDSSKDKVNDGVIFSNDTLRIKGNGTLNINSGNAHGIASDDDILITNAVININAVKSGLFAHENIEISGGTISINSGTNGIKTKKSVIISGGTTYISGGKKDTSFSVYSTNDFVFKGGCLYAAGNDQSLPAKSSFPWVIADVGSVSGGTAFKVSLNGKEVASFKPQNAYTKLLILSQDITSGSTVAVDAGGDKGSVKVSSGKNEI